jgi:hypothetical protein
MPEYLMRFLHRMKTSLTTGILAILLALSSAGSRCLAVDPPPSSILTAPIEEQLRYARTLGVESERMRSEVAKRRYVEKKQHREAIAAGLACELTIQRETMLWQSGHSGKSTAQDELSGSGLMGRLSALGIFALLLLSVYCSRDYVFRWCENMHHRFLH